MSAPQPQGFGPPGVRAYTDYALIIDARTPQEYAQDHLPGAINLPVVTQPQFAEVGTLHKTDPHAAYLRGAQYALRNVAQHIGEVITPLPRQARLLVYCFRGGKRSRAWAEPLRAIGFQVDVLPGGWKAYRAWVRDALEARAGGLPWRVLAGGTACGKTRLLHALAQQGAQVIDLEALACHRGSLLGALPGQPQPPQKAFDSALLHALATLNPQQPVWVENESKRIGTLQLPAALHAALQTAPAWQVSAPMPARVQACSEDYPHLAAQPQVLMQQLRPLKALVGGETLAHWQHLADAGATESLIESLMRQHYDPCYQRSMRQRLMPLLDLPDLRPATLTAAALHLMQVGAA